jgi:hypothetical protein
MSHNLRDQLAHFTGSASFTRHHLLPRMLLTEGVRWLADHAQAHWLTDAIASYQHLPECRAEHFQVWHLHVDSQTCVATLTMTNGNSDAALLQQHMVYTDFPLDEITLWLIAQHDHVILMSPSEY